MAEIKNRIDGIISFPEQAEKPIISELVISQQVMFVSVYGHVPEVELLQVAQDVRDEIMDLPDVSMATLVGNRDYEIAVEIQEHTLRQYQLSFDEIAAAMRAASIDLPGGSIKTDRGDVLLRSVGQSYTGADFAQTVIRTNPDGSRLTLADIAEIHDGFVEDSELGTFDKKPAISIRVDSVSSESELIISDQVNAYIAQKQMPPNVGVDSWSDTSHYVRGRLDMMQRKHGARGGVGAAHPDFVSAFEGGILGDGGLARGLFGCLHAAARGGHQYEHAQHVWLYFGAWHCGG